MPGVNGADMPDLPERRPGEIIAEYHERLRQAVAAQRADVLEQFREAGLEPPEWIRAIEDLEQ